MDGPIKKDSHGTVPGPPRNTKRNDKCVGVKAYEFVELYISAIINERSLDRLQQDQQLQHRLARSNSFVLPYSQQKYHEKTKKEYYFVADGKFGQNSLGSPTNDHVLTVEICPWHLNEWVEQVKIRLLGSYHEIRNF